MSATDQAFIRAYGGPPVSGKPQLRSVASAGVSELRATTTVTQNEIDPKVAATAGCTKSWLAHADECNCASGVLSVSAEGMPLIPVAQLVCIEMGLGSVIPTPHASFAATSRTINNSPFTKHDAENGKRHLHSGLGTQRVEFGASQKVSLSSFASAAAKKRALAVPLKAALEIDAVEWPTICESILKEHGVRFEQLANELRKNTAKKARVIAISGTRRKEGRTTLTLCLARALASKCKIAIVDADFESPGVAGQLRIGVERGWEAVLHGESQLADVMIESIQDQIAIVPLGSSIHEKTASLNYRIGMVLRALAENNELVLVDAGPVCENASKLDWIHEAGVDSVILAHDVRAGISTSLSAACARFSENLLEVGIAEMFVGSEALQTV